jgi:quinolinate synthase
MDPFERWSRPPYEPWLVRELDRAAERLRPLIPRAEWELYRPYVVAIRRLARERRAVILAHNYQTPEIFHGVADFVGDSLGLARRAAETDAEVVVQCGVHFMAETSKLLCPEKKVLIPDLRAGCSLAASITAADVRLLRERFPGTPVVAYVNTSAAVKAEVDICCTSANAVEVVESLGSEQVIFLPDEYLARYVASKTRVKVIAWHGHCEVHERFTAGQLRELKQSYPGAMVLAHPECPPEVLAEADFVGSTSSMSKAIAASGARRVILLTECSMSDNVQAEHPEVEFVRPCNLCPHMKRITLPAIWRSLHELVFEVTVDPSVATRARNAVERMLAIGKN